MTKLGLAARIGMASLAIAACSDEFGPPDDHLLARTTELVQYSTCNELEYDLETMLIREAWASIEMSGDSRFGGGVDDASDGAPESGDDDRTEGEDYSGTNNQETGVDEADFVKTDGYHIYSLNGNRLHIFGVPQFGDLVPESVTELEGNPQEMLIDSDAGRAVVFSFIVPAQLPVGHPLRALTGISDETTDDYYWWRAPTLTKITVLDIADRRQPNLIREVYYEGWYQTARKVDSSVRVSTFAMLAHDWAYSWWEILDQANGNKTVAKRVAANRIRAMALDDLIPKMYVRTPDGQIVTDALSRQDCQAFHRPSDSHGYGVSSIISLDLLGDTFAWDADHVISNGATFYSSTDTMVLAEPAHSWWWYWWFPEDPDQLNVHTFDISVPGQTRYTGSGRIEGRLVDQFSISEHEGAIRLATTTNQWRWWIDDDEPPPITNNVWVLEGDGAGTVTTVGHVGDIAPGESIQSARFLGDKGYLVTFLRTDPLWTIDLADRTNPRVVGELEVPGFSTYLHPLGDTELLSIGVGGDENGANWRTTISMFNVGDFAHPALTASLPIDGEQGWGWSEALSEHKAFQYFAPKQLLAVPQSNYIEDTAGNYRYLSKLELVTVEPGVGLTRRGAIDHSAYYPTDQYWYYNDIRRSIFMGDYIYAISDKAITVHSLSDLAKVTDAVLPGYSPDDLYWWW
ncbi:MAG: beta-propeller domain-containing protein [Kofleriaceae bacterium]